MKKAVSRLNQYVQYVMMVGLTLGVAPLALAQDVAEQDPTKIVSSPGRPYRFVQRVAVNQRDVSRLVEILKSGDGFPEDVMKSAVSPAGTPFGDAFNSSNQSNAATEKALDVIQYGRCGPKLRDQLEQELNTAETRQLLKELVQKVPGFVVVEFDYINQFEVDFFKGTLSESAADSSGVVRFRRQGTGITPSAEFYRVTLSYEIPASGASGSADAGLKAEDGSQYLRAVQNLQVPLTKATGTADVQSIKHYGWKAIREYDACRIALDRPIQEAIQGLINGEDRRRAEAEALVDARAQAQIDEYTRWIRDPKTLEEIGAKMRAWTASPERKKLLGDPNRPAKNDNNEAMLKALCNVSPSMAICKK